MENNKREIENSIVEIIKLFYGIEETKSLSTREVSKMVGMDEVKVNRILKIARHKMRKVITKK